MNANEIQIGMKVRSTMSGRVYTVISNPHPNYYTTAKETVVNVLLVNSKKATSGRTFQPHEIEVSK